MKRVILIVLTLCSGPVAQSSQPKFRERDGTTFPYDGATCVHYDVCIQACAQCPTMCSDPEPCD